MSWLKDTNLEIVLCPNKKAENKASLLHDVSKIVYIYDIVNIKNWFFNLKRKYEKLSLSIVMSLFIASQRTNEDRINDFLKENSLTK